MQRATVKQREEFIETLLSHLPEKINGADWSWFNDGRPFAKKLMRYGATLGRIAEMECNSPDYPAYAWRLPEAERIAEFKRIDERYQRELDRLAKKEERIREKVTELCAQFQCTPVFQGDPRGNTLKIRTPEGYTNDWGREGICVPTS